MEIAVRLTQAANRLIRNGYALNTVAFIQKMEGKGYVVGVKDEHGIKYGRVTRSGSIVTIAEKVLSMNGVHMWAFLNGDLSIIIAKQKGEKA